MGEKKNFERINYSLRPAKHIERKMFCEAFSKLSVLDNINNYRYIGMGSAYFSDFNLFHKILGINKLISIEGSTDPESKRRINFNKPYSCIDVYFGWTTEILPLLPWEKWSEKSIVWLDYIDKIKEFMFSDIETVMMKIKPGSIFIISVDISEDDDRDPHKNKHGLSSKEFKLKSLIENIGSSYVPDEAHDVVLNVENNKKIVRQIINNSILSNIKKRNGGYSVDEQVEYKQLFNIYYRDSADMLTIGGIIFTQDQKDKISDMFSNLDFIRSKSNTLNITVPKLTYREIHALDKTLPLINKDNSSMSEYKKIPLSSQDKKDYKNIYRYFPTFAETII